jgi:hypothetical protein
MSDQNAYLDILDNIHNCVLERHPEIHFQIAAAAVGDDIAGTIVYGPDDYLEKISETQCRFKIQRSDVGRFGMKFLSKIAVHIKRDRIGFCDPSGL